ncbi:DUF6707 family protein [Cronobacter turicensis]
MQGLQLAGEQSDREPDHYVQYVYTEGSYDPLARADSVFDDCEIYWYHTELNGLPERVTDADGQTVWRGQFSTWAKPNANSACRSGRCRRTCASRASKPFPDKLKLKLNNKVAEMTLKNILSELSDKNVAIKNAISLLPSRSIKTDKAIVETLTKLAYYLFIAEKEHEAMVICDELANIKFNNDYDYWAWVEYVLCLRIELSLKLINPEKKEISITIIKEALDSGEGLVKKLEIRFINDL